MAKIEASELTIALALNTNFYSIPTFQREYVWEKGSQIKKFWLDIFEHFTSEDGNDEPYFLGSLVTYRDGRENKTLNVIDGQQRIITTILLLCAIRDYGLTLDSKFQHSSTNLISDTARDSEGEDIFKPKVEVKYAEGRLLIDLLVSGKKIDEICGATATHDNIVNAYRSFGLLLEEAFQKDLQRLKKFSTHFVDNVSVVIITANGTSSALKIFETINNRGISLSSADLLKNLLFSKGSKEITMEQLQLDWVAFYKLHDKSSKKAVAFLRVFLLAKMPKLNDVKGDDIFNHFENRETYKQLGGTTKIISALHRYSVVQQLLFDGKSPDNAQCEPLKNFVRMAGKTNVAFHPVMLIGQNYQSKSFEALIECLIDLYLCCKVLRKMPGDIAREASEIKKIMNEALNEEQALERIEVFVQEVGKRAKINFSSIVRGESLEPKVVHQLLARLYWFVEDTAQLQSGRTISQFLDFKIEHIFPQTPSEDYRQSFFGFRSEDEAYVRSTTDNLGNLMLLDTSSNSSAGNSRFQQKKSVYFDSTLSLTKGLVSRLHEGRNTALSRTLDEIRVFEEWTEQAIALRNEDYASLFVKYMERKRLR